jgi:serine/threonine protein kinase
MIYDIKFIKKINDERVNTAETTLDTFLYNIDNNIDTNIDTKLNKYELKNNEAKRYILNKLKLTIKESLHSKKIREYLLNKDRTYIGDFKTKYNGTLKDLPFKDINETELYDVATYYIAACINAIKFMHENKIAYINIDPKNISLTDEGEIKIADFTNAVNVKLSHNLISRPLFAPPGFPNEDEEVSEKDLFQLDIFCLAKIIYFILKGEEIPYITTNDWNKYVNDVDASLTSSKHDKFKTLLSNLLKQTINNTGFLSSLFSQPDTKTLDVYDLLKLTFVNRETNVKNPAPFSFDTDTNTWVYDWTEDNSSRSSSRSTSSDVVS